MFISKLDQQMRELSNPCMKSFLNFYVFWIAHLLGKHALDLDLNQRQKHINLEEGEERGINGFQKIITKSRI